MCLAGTGLASWYLTQEVVSSSPFTVMTNIFGTEFSPFSENIWKKVLYDLGLVGTLFGETKPFLLEGWVEMPSLQEVSRLLLAFLLWDPHESAESTEFESSRYTSPRIYWCKRYRSLKPPTAEPWSNSLTKWNTIDSELLLLSKPSNDIGQWDMLKSTGLKRVISGLPLKPGDPIEISGTRSIHLIRAFSLYIAISWGVVDMLI